MHKLNKEEKAIMCLLSVASDEVSGQTIKTACRLSGGSVYVILDRLEDKGLIVSRKQTLEDTNGVVPRGGIHKRVHKRSQTLSA